MKRNLLTMTAILLSLTAIATDYDLNKPFGFCTSASRTDAASTYNITGGGCYTYPIPDDFTGKVVTLKSNGQDMKGTIQNAIKQNDVVILDGSEGDFIVSSNIGITASGKTILGINNARIRTQWTLTDDIRAALDAAGVPGMSTSGGGGTLTNGQTIGEEAEYNTRRIIIEMTGDNNENYRQSGCISLVNCQNIIIRNIVFKGPGSVDVGGNDLLSCTGAKNCWVDHCEFIDGMDGNFDITQKADFNTVSWCIFRYTNDSYMHQNTNLVGSSDSEATGYLNTTFAFNWWSTGCKQRMPMARVGKIHMLNNYYSCTGASLCMNPRKNSEFLIEGNYFAAGVKNCYKSDNATAVTWTSSNVIANTSVSTPQSSGATVTVPYGYTVATAADVPDAVQNNAGATLPYGGTGSAIEGTKGSIYWPMSQNDNAEVSTDITGFIASTVTSAGSNLTLRTRGTYGEVRFALFQAQSIETAPAASNAVEFTFTTATGYKFKASSIELFACKVGTNNGNIDIAWTDAGGSNTLFEAVSPNRNNEANNYFSYYSKDISNLSEATEGSCTLTVYLYNVGAMSDGVLQKKDIGLAQILIKGTIVDTATGIAKPVTLSTPVSTDYFDAAGRRVCADSRGLVIVRQHMADGSTKTVKKLNK